MLISASWLSIVLLLAQQNPSPGVLLNQANTCFRDPQCGQQQAWELYAKAFDLGATDADCFLFYYGQPKDWPRARTCFERNVARQSCASGSPSLERLYLAVMYLDSQGGPAGYETARDLFSGCFKDAGVQQILDEVKSHQSGGASGRRSLDFCDDIGGTTFDLQACQKVHATKTWLRSAGIEKSILPRLDSKGRELYAKAEEAWQSFIKSDAQRASDEYRGGSLRSVTYSQRQNDLDESRLAKLEKLFDYRTDQAHGAPAYAKADRSLNAAYQKALKGQDQEARQLLQASERAWIAYRDAEADLYRHLFGQKFGESAVDQDVKTKLTLDRTVDLSAKNKSKDRQEVP